MSAKHLFVGNLVLDDIVYADGGTHMATPGGNSLYATVGAKLWHDDVGIVSVVGQDWPVDYTQTLKNHGIDTGALRNTGQETLRTWALYEENGHRNYVSRNRDVSPLTISPFASIAPTFEQLQAFTQAAQAIHQRMTAKPDDLPEAYWAAQSVHLCPIPLAVGLAWKRALVSQPQIAVTIDILPFPSPADLTGPNLQILLQQTQVFLPSQAEVESLQPDYDPLSFCQTLLRHGLEAIVIKEGQQGALVCHQAKRQQRLRLTRVPAYPAQVVDATGAGDSFCGGFSIGWAKTQNPLEAALYGTVSASFLIEDFGALHGLTISKQAAERRLNQLRKQVTNLA